MDLGSEKRRRRCKTRRRRPQGHDGNIVPVPPAVACDSGKRASSPPKSTSSSDDEKVKRVRMKDSLKVESLIVSHSLKQRYESASQSSSSSPSSAMAPMEEDGSGPSSVSPTAAVPPAFPAAATATSGGGAMSKLTDRMKLKVTGYIELLKKVDQPFSDPNDKSWITLFVSDMCSGGMKLTTEDVLEWIEELPGIFTPEAIDILRQHYNRLRAMEEEKNAVHQNLRRVLSEMDGYEADDDSADDYDDDGNKEASLDEGESTSDTT